MSSSHAKRLWTALALLPVLALAVWLGGWWLFAALLVVSSLAQLEFHSLFRNTPGLALGSAHLAPGMVLGAGVLAAAFTGHLLWGLGFLVAAFWLAGLAFLFASDTGPDAGPEAGGRYGFARASVFVMGLVYVPVGLQFLLAFSPLEIAYVLAATMASDTGAFYCGKLIGGPKIWPRVSPNKTWAGSAGGLLLCVAVSLTMGFAWGKASPWAFVVLACVVNLAAQFGDFFESALKRSLNVKDSGTILPGHGGLLDRIDALLLAIPAYAACRALHPFFQ